MINLSRRPHLFWLCQCSGWAVYALLTEVMIKIPSDEPWHIQLPHLFLDTLCGFTITLVLRNLYFRAYRLKKYVVTAHIVLLVLASFTWTQFKWVSLQWLYNNPWKLMSWFDFGTWTTASLTMLATWTAGYYGIKSYLDVVEQRERAEKATHLAKEAQLKMLRYQLNPHFMFNSINAISTLILKEENHHAVSVLEKLCDFLRYGLYTDPLKKIPVSEEVTMLRTYVDIEKARFRSKLNVKIETDAQIESLLIPSMLVQPLVENVLKHGMQPNQTVSVTVEFSQMDDGLSIVVTDDGNGFENHENCKRGIGLTNCRDRLRLMYQGKARLVTENNASGGASVTVFIPHEETLQNDTIKNAAG
ncbi:histidine kinase [Salinimonas sp. HHU 13199]|uniref:Histidine kinase n=2 Tax=Salinimonas profundi TaxID=2729140 RepID=A0ABR8LK08_9ALTE|nr:histidine kinase [Salinimonas profundi]